MIVHSHLAAIAAVSCQNDECRPRPGCFDEAGRFWRATSALHAAVAGSGRLPRLRQLGVLRMPPERYSEGIRPRGDRPSGTMERYTTPCEMPPRRAYVWDPSRAAGAAAAGEPPAQLCHVVVAALRRHPRSAMYDHAADDSAFLTSVFPLGCW